MNSNLQRLLHELVLNGCDNREQLLANVASLRLMHPESSDFSDEYLNTFSPAHLPLVYMYVRSLWPEVSDDILKRCLFVDDNLICRRNLKKAIDSLSCIINVEDKAILGYSDLVAHKERPSNYKDVLREAIFTYLDDPKQLIASLRVKELEPTNLDFDDLLLDSMSGENRLDVYLMLLFWSGRPNLKLILKRRINVETDPDCRRLISAVLASLERFKT